MMGLAGSEELKTKPKTAVGRSTPASARASTAATPMTFGDFLPKSAFTKLKVM